MIYKAFFFLIFFLNCNVIAFAQSNEELARIFDEDQTDRQNKLYKTDLRGFMLRDSLRLLRVTELLDAGKITSADDYLNAAFIFQHGRDSTAHWKAFELSSKAVTLGCTKPAAKWLTAASFDRYLLSTGSPQWYGTQFQIKPDGQWILRPIDSTAVTDSQRVALGVPTLSETLKSLTERNMKKEK